MIGDDITRVADVVRNATGGQDQDFASVQNVQFNPPYVSAKDLFGVLDDSPLSSPMDLQIEQRSYAYANAPDDKYVIVVYKIKNTGLIPLSNLHTGLFADWDIDVANANKAGYDASRKLGYVHSLANDTLYGAIKLLSNGNANNYSLDLDGSNGIDPNGGGYTTEEKYNSLSTMKITAGGSFGNDVAHVVGSVALTLPVGDSVEIAFAIIGGDSLQDIQASADAAQIKYDLEVGVDNLVAESELIVYPNPTNGVIKLLSDEMIELVTIRNVLGEIVLTTQQTKIDLSNYANGVYFVEIKTSTKHIIQKVFLTK